MNILTEISPCVSVKEACFGIYQCYGDDEIGVFHMISLGFIFFTVTFYVYKQEEN